MPIRGNTVTINRLCRAEVTDAEQGRDLRRQHGEAEDPEKRGDDGAACQGAGGRREGQTDPGGGQSSAGAVGDPALCRQGGEPGEIRRYLRDYSAIRVSRSVRDTAYRVLQCKEAMLAETNREPTLEEIARRLELPLEEVSGAMDAISAPVSLYEPVYSDGGDPLTVMDQVCDMRNTDEQWIERIALREAISRLGERERRILAMRFYDGRTQMEVAQSIGISQAQVSRLEKNALSAIRKNISS